MRIIREVKRFIDEVTTKSDGIQIGLYKINTEGSHRLYGALTDEGLLGMLEAADKQTDA